MSPGFGCDRAAVDTIADELQYRVAIRGDTGQIQKQELAAQQIAELHLKMDTLDRKLDMRTFCGSSNIDNVMCDFRQQIATFVLVTSHDTAATCLN
eukprot:gene31354-38730_t